MGHIYALVDHFLLSKSMFWMCTHCMCRAYVEVHSLLGGSWDRALQAAGCYMVMFLAGQLQWKS
jgi:hypothetical protein